MSNKTEVYADFHTYVGDDSRDVYTEYKRITVRVGDKSARNEHWNVSTDKRAVFSKRAIPLLREMVKSDKLVLRLVPYGENPVTAVFDTRGLAIAAKPLAENCNWSF